MTRALVGVGRVLEGVAVPAAGDSLAVLVLSGAVEALADGQGAGAAGGRVSIEVTLIRPGDSVNRLRYRPEVLREAAPLFEGAAAFCDHPGMLDMGRAGVACVTSWGCTRVCAGTRSGQGIGDRGQGPGAGLYPLTCPL